MENDERMRDKFEVLFGDNPVSMESARFTAVPDEDREQHDIEALNRQFQLWGDKTDWKRVEFFINRRGNQGESVVKLKLHTRRGDRLEYLYRVTPDGRVIPVWELFYNRI
ncbi:hypothetical protein [Schlesneria paludicola]|uniref:hypothetical protein n=1 Tax=Schlesneria paludicola TaxID=360056 RepID=UPI0012F79D23|nr:hypothetical protein [Schlesneria paludicola]